jgi:hypothetical protein
MQCLHCDRDWPDEFNVCPLCAEPLIAAEIPPPPDLEDLRRRLTLLDDQQIERLAIVHFRQIKAKFSGDMRLDTKINLLLDHCRRHPEDANRLNELLK